MVGKAFPLRGRWHEVPDEVYKIKETTYEIE